MKLYLKKINDLAAAHDESLKLLEKIYKKPLDIIKNDYGKPKIKGETDFHFNISHSGEWICIVTSNNEVGCDIQKHTKYSPLIVKRYYSQSEKILSEKNFNYFFEIWTRKEAFVKATGRGLTKNIRDLDTTGYDIITLDAPDGYSLSVCEKTEKINIIEKELIIE